MKAIKLKKLLPPKKLETIIKAFSNLIPDPVCVLDAKGAALFGDYTQPHTFQFPLLLQGEPVGEVRGGEGAKEVAQLLEIQLKTELEKKLLAAETLNNYNELTMLYRVAEDLSINMKPKEVAEMFMEYVRNHVHQDTMSTMLFNSQSGLLEVLHAKGNEEAYQLALKPGHGVAGRVFLTGKSEIINDVTRSEDFEQGPFKIASMICTPLKTSKGVIGVINLSSNNPYQYTARDKDLVYTLATRAASAIQNAMLFEELQQSEAEYRSLYENAVEGIFRCKADRSILGVNPSMVRILGFDSEDELMESISDFAVDCFVEKSHFDELNRILFHESVKAGFETQFYRKDKSIIWVSINAMVSRDEAGVIQHVDGTIIDITERIKREKAEREKEILQHQSDEYKQLLHVLCHDLGNPLGSIRSFLELLDKDHSLYSKYRGFLAMAANNGIDIIKSVRKMSALKERKTTLKLERLRLKELLDEASVILYQHFKTKNVVFNNYVDEEIMVLVDRISFISSVVNNLLSNAIKFSFPGDSIDIHASTNGDRVVLTVQDRGIGIPPSILNSIFDTGAKTNRQGTNGESGVGFGMPLVKTFINAYGGEITISSIEKEDSPNDHGTCVRVELQTGFEESAETHPS